MEPTAEDIASASAEPPRRRDRGDLQQKVTYLPDLYRLLPAAPDAEKGILSSFLLAPNEIGAFCVEKGITPDWMHLPAHATILRRLLEMWNANEPIDKVTVPQKLHDTGELQQVGGWPLITELFCYLPTAANAGYYVEIVEEQWIARQVIMVGTEFAARGYDEHGDTQRLLEDFEKKVLSIRRGESGQMKTVSAKEGAMEAMQSIEAIYDRRGAITGLPTGFAEIDKMLDGLHPAEMTIIAARPSMGKTALAMNIAEHIAIEAKLPVAVYSLEMGAAQLHQRLLCSRARVNMHRVREGFLAERDFPALTHAASKIADSPLHVVDASGTSIAAVRAHARRLHRQHGLKAIFVDYLQLLKSLTKRAQNDRQLEISEISSGLKELAKELNIPLVVLAQLNRATDNRPGGRPKLSDLRESGSIEQDADVVGLLVREEYYAENEKDRQASEGRATLIIAKQRCGPVGDIPLTFLKEFSRFENRAQEPEAPELPIRDEQRGRKAKSES